MAFNPFKRGGRVRTPRVSSRPKRQRAIIIEIKGFDELLDRFERLPIKLQRKGAIEGLRRAAKVVLRRTLSLAPTDTGDMKRFIKVKALKRSRKRIGLSIQAPSRRDLGIPPNSKKGQKNPKNAGYYPAFIEYGTRFRRGNRFMTHALNQTKDAALNAMIAHMKTKIDAFAKGKN